MLKQQFYLPEDEASESLLMTTTDDKTRYGLRNENHANKAFETLNSLRINDKLCDVILAIENISNTVTVSEIKAHRVILAACSPYFYAMLTDFNESTMKTIHMKAIDATALKILVDYMYTSNICITEENVQVLLPAASILQLNDVRQACSEFLQRQLDPSNCLGIRAFADVHSCCDLLSFSQHFTEKNFSDVVQGDEFLNLSVDGVCELICSDQLMVPSEEQVFEAVVSWVRFSISDRESHMSQLMQHVRLPLLSREYLLQRVEDEILVKTNPICKDFLIEAMKYHLLPSETRNLFKSPRTRPRTPLGLPKIMYAVGGQAPKAIRSVECFDFNENKWLTVAELPSRRCRAGVVVLHDQIYAVGGFNGSLRVRTVDIYDPVKDCWVSAPAMEMRRSTLGSAVLNHLIYAVGGFDGTTGLSSVECFDPKSNEWSMVANMSVRRSSVGVGVLNGFLYAVGGYDGACRHCLSSVERFSPDLNQWKSVADMSTRRSGAGVGVVDNLLYAVGGHDGPLVRKSVEVYNPELNHWTQVADMCYCRRNAGVMAVNSLLYVIGGDDGTTNLSTVEVYNPKTDTWTLLTSAMSIGRSYAGVAVIDKVV